MPFVGRACSPSLLRPETAPEREPGAGAPCRAQHPIPLSFVFPPRWCGGIQQFLRQFGLQRPARLTRLLRCHARPGPFRHPQRDAVKGFHNQQAHQYERKECQYSYDLNGFDNRRHFHISTLNKHCADVGHQHHGHLFCGILRSARCKIVPFWCNGRTGLITSRHETRPPSRLPCRAPN